MLDFIKAMEIAKRACDHMKVGCSKDCPCFVEDYCSCSFWCNNDMHIMEWQEVERRLIEWDNAHPEPQYPTWEEWQKENFPDSVFHVFPCSFCAPAKLGCTGTKGFQCDACQKNTIPADIAKKLGIEPKEE